MDKHMVTTIPDVDIEEQIRKFIRDYDPLKQARGRFGFKSEHGHVTVWGNVKSAQARRVLIDNVPDIAGVVSLDDSQLFDDEALHYQIAEHIRSLSLMGLRVLVNYGNVVLTGASSPNLKVETLAQSVQQIPGVRQVVTEFY